MARRAVISLRGLVIAHRQAGRNLINGLHREVINLIEAQLSGCVLFLHARPPPRWMSVPSRSGARMDMEARNGPLAVADWTMATIAVAITYFSVPLPFVSVAGPVSLSLAWVAASVTVCIARPCAAWGWRGRSGLPACPRHDPESRFGD